MKNYVVIFKLTRISPIEYVTALKSMILYLLIIRYTHIKPIIPTHGFINLNR